MRIRRRPQGQLSLSWLLPSDPPAPQPPPNASPRDHHHHLELAAGDKREEELHPNADLRDEAPALLPLLPQDNVVERGRDLQGAQRAPAAEDGHRSLENGHQHMPEPVANDVISQAMPVSAVSPTVQKEEVVKDDSSSGGGGIKKRRGSDVLLLEGSRCSRVNGRGWRCSQPTLVGYSLCEHHLGKARMRNAAWRAANGRKLGRKHQQNAPAVAVTAAPKADVPPPSVSHC